MTPLTNNAVDANALESSVLKLWQEFLARYFDGGAHDVGAVMAKPFPKAELHFQQSAVSQPLEQRTEVGGQRSGGVAITMVWSEGGRKWTGWENVAGTRQEMCYERVHWNFWLRANGANGKALGKGGSDALFGLLSNRGETHALGAKGICRLKVAAPQAIQETDYVLRLLTVGATLRFPILSQRDAGPD